MQSTSECAHTVGEGVGNQQLCSILQAMKAMNCSQRYINVIVTNATIQ